MIIDSHAHIFPPQVIHNVSAKPELAKELDLVLNNANKRTSPPALKKEAQAAGAAHCLILPTGSKDSVSRANTACFSLREQDPYFFTAGTLHPYSKENEIEINRFIRLGIHGIKLCSFSQGFDLTGDETFKLLDLIRTYNLKKNAGLFLIFDTFYKAHHFFNTLKEHTTTPEKLGAMVRRYPEIDFVGAHMGGLTAPFELCLNALPPQDNLYLETSNAGHTLKREEFIQLLEIHGPRRILFGTDWPWFLHSHEIPHVNGLMERAGFNEEEQHRVFAQNILELLQEDD